MDKNTCEVELAVCITLDQAFCKKASEFCTELTKYDIEYIFSKSTFPHLTLSAGKVNKKNITSIQDIVKSVTSSNTNFTIMTNGLGIYFTDTPVWYVRFETSDLIIDIKNKIETLLTNIWQENIDYNSYRKWAPKVTLAYKDTSTSTLSSVAEIAKNYNFIQTCTAKGIGLILFDSTNEVFVNHFDLIPYILD